LEPLEGVDTSPRLSPVSAGDVDAVVVVADVMLVVDAPVAAAAGLPVGIFPSPSHLALFFVVLTLYHNTQPQHTVQVSN